MNQSTANSTSRPTRLQVSAFIFLCMMTLFLSLRDYSSFQLGVYTDDANYVILAQSLVNSDTYGLINGPGPDPASAPFPFGYPLVLAPIALVLPEMPEAMKTLSLVATIANGVLLFWGWRWLSDRSHWWALGIVGLYLLSPLTIRHTRMVMSEPVFTTFVLLAMLLAERATQHEPKWPYAVPAGAALAMALFTRIVGAVLVPVVGGYMLLRCKPRLRGPMLVGGAMILTVSLVLAVTPVSVSSLVPSRYFGGVQATFVNGLVARFTGQAEQLGDRYRGSASPDARGDIDTRTLWIEDFLIGGIKQHLGRDLRETLLPVGGGGREEELADRLGIPLLPRWIGYSTSILVLYGYVRWLRKEVTLFSLAGILYFGALFFWVWQGPRLLYPIQAQLYMGFLVGVEGILSLIALLNQRIGAYVIKWGIAIAFGLLLGLSTYQSLNVENSRDHTGDLATRTAWIKANTDPSAIILTEAPAVDFLYGDRQTVQQPFSMGSAAELREYLTLRGVDFVLIAPQIVWQPVHVPTYSRATELLYPFVRELAQEGLVEQVYDSQSDLIEVYRVDGQAT